MREHFARLFRETAPRADYVSYRFETRRDERIDCDRGVVSPPHFEETAGAMVTVRDGGGTGYAATPDLTREGLAKAAERAAFWARMSGGRAVANFSALPKAKETGVYATETETTWQGVSLADKIDLVKAASDALRVDDRIVDWGASLWATAKETLILSSEGADIHQTTHQLLPSLHATANRGGESQTRTLGRDGIRQGGFEIVDMVGFNASAKQIGHEAIELLLAPNCPEGRYDIVIGGEQMVLQIHESIGHPLELDRILGDERNYAGTSFVTPDMFGTYAYGSPLLNVTFDPDVIGECASFAFDDEGTRARREYLIKDGILLRGLGGASSQARSNLPGVATERACAWNRPPIDRMSNLNIEPGQETFEALVGGIEDGVYMTTNRSWSIDDSRNKFQFGCEYGRRIRGGKLAEVVRNSNYRGISSAFWRSLTGVGNRATLFIGGSPNCGKGEPNQAVTVGHATPPCRFAAVEIFGGH